VLPSGRLHPAPAVRLDTVTQEARWGSGP